MMKRLESLLKSTLHYSIDGMKMSSSLSGELLLLYEKIKCFLRTSVRYKIMIWEMTYALAYDIFYKPKA